MIMLYKYDRKDMNAEKNDTHNNASSVRTREKSSIFDNMKDSYKEEDKAKMRRSDTKNHSALMRSIYRNKTY